MLPTLAALTALALIQQTDTTVPVRPGARLDLNNFGGDVVVKTWGQSAVRIQADHSGRDHIVVSGSGTVVSVRATSRHGAPQTVDYQITVPTWMALNLSGVYTDITVDGSQGEVTAETVQGDVKVHGGSGFISLKSVEGAITLDKARGRIDANSVNEGITITDAAGDVSAETVNGDITLDRIESSNVDVSTVDGDVAYDGSINDGGRYRFSTHDGDLSIGLPQNANVTVSVSTFDGGFESYIPVKMTELRKHRYTVTLGSGSARLEVESFDGDIKLRRPEAAPTQED